MTDDRSDVEDIDRLVALVGDEDLALRVWTFFMGVLEDEGRAAQRNAFYSTLTGPREHSREVERVMHDYAAAMRELVDVYLSLAEANADAGVVSGA